MNKNLLILILLLPLILSANIQWQENGVPVRQGDNFAKLTTADFGDGTFLNVWNDYRDGTRGIYAQRVDSNGNTLWNEDGIEIYQSETMQSLYGIYSATDNTVLICWYSYNEDMSDSSEFRMQKLDINGNLLWGDSGIASPYNYNYVKKVVPDNAGGLFLFWVNLGNNNAVCVRILSDGTVAPGWENFVYLVSDNYSLNVCINEENGCLVQTTMNDINYLQLIDSNGIKQWQDQGLQIENVDQYNDIDLVNIGSEYIFSQNHGDATTSTLNLYKIDSAGNFVWNDPVTISSETSLNDVNLFILSDYSTVINYTEEDSLKFQKMSPEGILLWGEGVTFSYENSNFYNSQTEIVIDSEDNTVFTIVLHDDIQSRMLLQKLDISGSPEFSEPGYLINESTNHGTSVNMCFSNDNYYFGWYNEDQNSEYLKYQIIDYSGNAVMPDNGEELKTGLGGFCKAMQLLENGDNPIIIWQDYPGFQNTKIKMQILNSDGTPQLAENGMFITNSGIVEQEFMDADISYNSNTIAAIWTEYNQNESSVYIQGLDTSGNMLWSDTEGVVLASSNSYYVSTKVSCYDNGGSDEFYAGWTYISAEGYTSHTAAQKLINGIPQWDAPYTFPQNDQIGVELIDIEEKFYIWKNLNWSDESIYVSLLTEDGVVEEGWPEEGVFIGSGHFHNNNTPLTTLVPEGLLITWLDQEQTDDNQHSIWGQLIDYEGNILWENGGKILATTNSLYSYNMFADEDIYLVFNDMETYSDDNYFIQKYNMQGDAVWGSAVQLTNESRLAYSMPQLSSIGEDVLLIWEHGCENNHNTMLKAQRISPDGELLLGSEGLTVADAYMDQTKPQFYVNGSNAFVSWIDERSTYVDEHLEHFATIYSQKLLLEPTDSPEDNVPSSNVSLMNYPNPFNPTTEIRFQVSDVSVKDAKIEIYNVKGQLVKTFVCNLEVNEARQNQIQSVTWNGTDSNKNQVSSGIYFYHLNVEGNVLQSRKMLLLK